MTSSNSSSYPGSLKEKMPGASNAYDSVKCELGDIDIVVSSSDDGGGVKGAVVERKVSPISSSRHYAARLKRIDYSLVVSNGNKIGAFGVLHWFI